MIDLVTMVVRDAKQRERVRVPVVSYSSDEYIWFLEVGGAEQAVQAVWSRLVSRYAGKDTVVGTDTIIIHGEMSYYPVVDGSVKYLVQRRTRGNRSQMVFMHPAMHRMSYQYVYGGTDTKMSDWFPSALTKVNVPVRTEWMEWFWQMGIQRRLIRRGRVSIGTPVWEIINKPDKWQAIATDYVKEVLHG